jgi:hypothetical protein
VPLHRICGLNSGGNVDVLVYYLLNICFEFFMTFDVYFVDEVDTIIEGKYLCWIVFDQYVLNVPLLYPKLKFYSAFT